MAERMNRFVCSLEPASLMSWWFSIENQSPPQEMVNVLGRGKLYCRMVLQFKEGMVARRECRRLEGEPIEGV